jgi:hypothetical protein
MPEAQEPFDRLIEQMNRTEAVRDGRACLFCPDEFTAEELDDPDAIYREVAAWVHGPKLQSPVLRIQTGRIAHKRCIEKLLEGQAPDQQSIPGLEQ